MGGPYYLRRCAQSPKSRGPDIVEKYNALLRRNPLFVGPDYARLGKPGEFNLRNSLRETLRGEVVRGGLRCVNSTGSPLPERKFIEVRTLPHTHGDRQRGRPDSGIQSSSYRIGQILPIGQRAWQKFSESKYVGRSLGILSEIVDDSAIKSSARDHRRRTHFSTEQYDPGGVDKGHTDDIWIRRTIIVSAGQVLFSETHL